MAAATYSSEVEYVGNRVRVRVRRICQRVSYSADNKRCKKSTYSSGSFHETALSLKSTINNFLKIYVTPDQYFTIMFREIS